VPQFVRSSVIHAPVERVFAFHEREDALALLSPPFPPLKVMSRTGGILPGARVVLKIGPLTWVAAHTGYERNVFFQDEQVSGPFARWVHRHEFSDEDGQCRLTDRVTFSLPGGPLVNVLAGWAVRLGLRQMFRHRHAVTRRHCETTRAAHHEGHEGP
jgi:ligand-binding SRPBCC domain-containing protein